MQHQQRAPRPRTFALCQPGLGPLLRREAMARGHRPGVVSNDGRADVVRLSLPSWSDGGGLRVAETVCADLGIVRLLPSVRATAAQLTEPRVSRAIADLAGRGLVSHGGRLRLVVRLRDERTFSRSQLREAIARRFGSRIVRGHETAHELWLVQDSRDTLRLGIRVPALEAARTPRRAERPGSLRPSVAAALVMLAGPSSRVVLDPCCGSGTILAEAVVAGKHAIGGDLDQAAAESATLNTGVDVARLDARRLPFRTDEFDAALSNLPFGRQYDVQGSPVAWYRRTLSEMLRVAPRAAVLAPATPPFRQALGRLPARLVERHDIELLGRRTTIWFIERIQAR